MFCRYHQWRISSALNDGREPAGRSGRHAERCPRCREFLRRAAALGERLRSEARTCDRPPGHLAIADTEKQRRRALPLRRLVPFAAAACVAGFVLLWAISRPSTNRPPERPPVARQVPPIPAEIFAPARAIEKPLAEALGSTAGLESELDHFAGDIRSAVGAMLSYVPARPERRRPTTRG